MTRIIAGSARGRRLSVPAQGTRPTSDRVREAMFSTISSALLADDRPWSSVHVIDGYAGTGALGLEALSRGAASVLLIEKRAPAAAIIRRNIASVGLPGATVVTSSLLAFAQRPAERVPAALVLLDPPYEVSSLTIAAELRALHASGWLEDGALVVVERPRADTVDPLPWGVESRRDYGDTTLWYGRVEPDEPGEPSDA